MGINKENVKRALKKALIGTKVAYRETSKFVKEYGPPVHNHLKSLASGAVEAFEVKEPRHKVSFRVRPMGRLPGLVRKKQHVRVRRADFNNIGMRW